MERVWLASLQNLLIIHLKTRINSTKLLVGPYKDTIMYGDVSRLVVPPFQFAPSLNLKVFSWFQ